MKQFISRRSFLKAAGAATALTAVSLGAPAASAEETNCFLGEKSAVTILYTNDVHTYIDKKSPELTYAGIAALKQSYVDAGQNVLLVDAGDHIQGTAYGSMDDGETIIRLMSEAGYDLATPGNHEFDYGMARAKAAMKEAAFPYVSCNWVDLRTGLKVLPSIKIFTIGGARIAFVGVTTPETFTKSTPAYFMNASQTKYIYDILGGDDGQKLYKAVQKAIDKAKLLGATTIIGLGHLGVDPSSAPWTSEEVIAHTTGFDAFIDGHSHTVMENKQVTDASGKAVTLTQTGSYFKNVGKMTPEIGHVMDIMATCVDLADAEYPTTYKGHDILPMEGKSLLPIFKTGHRKGHDYLGFEHFNERAFLSNDGWKLVRPKNNSQWELYNLNEDRSEQHDLAAKYPEKVAEMSKAYEAWAKRCMVEPYPGQKKK